MSKETLAALASAMLFVALQHHDKPWRTRVGIAGVSGGLGYSLAAEVAEWSVWLGPSSSMALVTAFGYAILDFIGSLIADRVFIKQVLRDIIRRKP